VDKHLEVFVRDYGLWVYALLFLIIFVETGLVVMPFLPGDSLLFVVGALCGVGLMSYPVACAVLIVAAILGDQCNYTIGRYLGPKVFQWENSRFFNKAAFDRTHHFYERYGGITLVAARFIPFVRTLINPMCGIVGVPAKKFFLWNVVGAVIWTQSVIGLGFFLGERIEGSVDKYLLPIVGLIIAISVLPVALEILREWRTKRHLS